MKFVLPKVFAILIFSAIILIFCSQVYAQRSAAELIVSVPPPEGRVKYNDGVRQINIVGNYLYITNFWAGLQIVDISDIRNPRQIAFLNSDDESFNTFVDGDYAYVANHSTGVQVYNVSNKDQITRAAVIKPAGNVFWVAAEFPNLFVALGNTGFAIMDISDMNNPVTIKLEIPGEWIQQVYKKDNLLFAAAKRGGLIIYDISDLENPVKLSQFSTGFNTMMVQTAENIAYVADGPGGVLVVDVNDPQKPKAIKRFSDLGFVGNLHKVGNYVYLANRDIGLQIVNITDPENPFLEGRYQTEDISYGVFKKDIYVFLAANTSTLIMRHNNAPVLENIDDQTLDENVPFTLQLNAAEPDGDEIKYEITNMPEGAEFAENTGLFSWIPTFEQSGTYNQVIFRVVEQTETQLSVGDTINFAVNHINRLPDLPPIDNETVDENAALAFTIPPASDPDKEDQNRITYRAEKLPSGATFDPITRTFNWNPTFEQSGVYIVDFITDDGNNGIDRESTTITVYHGDRKPVIAAVASKTIDEATPLTIEIAGEDFDREDQDKISFKMENLPKGAEFNPDRRVFTWIPSFDQSGTYNGIMAIMTAGALSDTSTFSITVNHVNRVPQLAEVLDRAVEEDKELVIQISGSDPDTEDDGKLIYSIENLPSGATFDATSQVFRWKPGFDQSGQYPDIRFTVTDENGLSHTRSISINAIHVNRTPQIDTVAAKSVAENTTLDFQLTGSDPDKEDTDKLIYAAESLPEGATLNPQTGQVQWTPTYDQSGDYSVTFSISDGEYSHSSATTITVAHVNRPPVLTEIPSQSVNENDSLRFTISGSDADVEDEGKLTYSAQNLPEGATFDAATQTFRWVPRFDQSGQYDVPFQISDPSGLNNQKIVAISVNHVNRAPSLEAVATQTVDENQLLTIQLSGTDPDAEDDGTLLYEIDNAPEGAALEPATGTLTWTPTFDQSGEYTATVRVKDPSGLNAEQMVSITVNHVNRPPAFEALSVQNGDENAPLQFLIKATDPDQEDSGLLTYSAINLPEGANLDKQTSEFNWTPTYEQSGEYTGNIQVTDVAGLTDELEFTVTINHVNREPSLPVVTGATFQENAAGSLTLPEGADPDVEDDGKLTYSVEGLPEGAAFDSTNRSITWTPGYEQSGNYQLTAVVDDPDGLKARQSFEIVVEHVNRPPQFDAMGQQAREENQAIEFTLAANDPDREDSGKLIFSATELPQGASLDPASGKFSWKPNFGQSGSYQVDFAVKDPAGESAATTVAVEIAHVNRAPELPKSPNLEFTENSELQFTLPEGSDPDTEDQGKLSYSTEKLPKGAQFNPTERSILWTPTFEQSGDYQATYTVSDPQGMSASQTVKITVKNVNRPPQLAAMEKQVGKENRSLSFSLKGSDPDKEDRDNLKYDGKNLPKGAKLEKSKGKFTWTPSFEQSSTYTATFEVKDKDDEKATIEVEIEIANENRDPEIESPGDKTVKEGSTLNFRVKAKDPDKEDSGTLQLEAKNLPAGAEFDAGSGKFTWKPGSDQQGNHKVEFIVKDPSGASDKVKITIQVEDVPEEAPADNEN